MTGPAMAQDSAGPAPVLSLSGVSKSFAGVRALAGVDFDVMGGEVHALLGENGAGKSTLMKVLFGVYRPDTGRISIEGADVGEIAGPRSALAMGIGLVSQEPTIVPQLDVAQNIYLGQKGALSLSSRKSVRAAARDVLAPLAPNLRITVRVGDLGMADRQIVEIARALARGGRILAFDEPTSSLTPSERDSLFAIIRSLKQAGKAIIYISHRMSEIAEISDRVTVLRDGRVVATGRTDQFTPAHLSNLIAGRTLSLEAKSRTKSIGEADAAAPPLAVENLTNDSVRGVNLVLRRGEIFGLAGLVGSGRTELARAIFGADRRLAGRILIDGKAVEIRGPRDAMAAGIALIPEDRRGQALVPQMTVEQNLALASQATFSRGGVIRARLRRREVLRYIEELGIRPKRPDIQIRDLSGGNQQKVVIARWLHSGARVFLFDEPTRGIDVGAKAEIHELLRRLATQGAAVLVISSELSELLLLADRLGIMREGRLLETIRNEASLNEEGLMQRMIGAAVQGEFEMKAEEAKGGPAASRGAGGRGRIEVNWIRQAGVAIGCIGLFVIFSALTSTFYQPDNLLDIMLQSAINAVVAVGMTLVVMTKGIDLSVGSIVGVSSMVSISLLGSGILLAVGVGLIVGLACGLINGILIAKLKLPDFIVTLGTMSIYRGAALIYTNGQPIYGIDKVFRAIFAGEVIGIPTPVLIALAVAVLAFLLVRFTTLGEQIIAVGGNEEAARLAGIDVDRVKITVYALSGVLSSLAGFILVARIGAAEPIGGNGFELQAIGAAVIGGASLFGGEGNPFGSLIGALTLGAMRNGLTLLNVPSFWQFVATGVVVILAVLADQVTRKRR